MSPLQPGASEEEIRQAEALLSVTFPEEIRESYRVHNGSSHFLIKSHALLSLQEMVDFWRRFVPPAEEQYPDKPIDLDSEFVEPGEDDNWRSLLSPEQDTYISIEEG